PDIGDELIWIGFARPSLGAVPPVIELQARWFALLCSNKCKLPEGNTIRISRQRGEGMSGFEQGHDYYKASIGTQVEVIMQGALCPQQNHLFYHVKENNGPMKIVDVFIE
ncbi:unnamed protein product, partial [Didymodactylos carnosus]